MAHSVEIPQDIIDNVIAALGNDERSLQQCALVSSSFLLPSRKQLFYSITFGSSNNLVYRRLHQLHNPLIRSFVRRISVYHGWLSKPTSESDKLLLSILQLSFCHLEEFSLWCVHAVNWSGLSGELKDALSTLIHSPTLKILYLHNINNAPITLFLGIVHLTKLHLYDVLLNYSDGEQPSSLTPATTASHTVIDQCVLSFCNPTRGRRFPKFVPFMSHLRVLEIQISPSFATSSDFAILSFLMRSLRANFTFPATLEHLKLEIEFGGSDNLFNHSKFYKDLRRAHVWGHLDSIVTDPIGSRLQRVELSRHRHQILA